MKLETKQDIQALLAPLCVALVWVLFPETQVEFLIFLIINIIGLIVVVLGFYGGIYKRILIKLLWIVVR